MGSAQLELNKEVMRKVVLMDYVDNGLEFLGLQRIPKIEEDSPQLTKFKRLSRNRYPKKVDISEFYNKMIGETYGYEKVAEKDIERSNLPIRVKISLLDEFLEDEV